MFNLRNKVHLSFLVTGIIACLLFLFALGITAQDGEQATLVVVMPEQLQADSTSTRLQVDLPGSARVGDVVTGTLLAREAVNLDGFQVTLHFDPAALRLTAIDVAADLENSGRDMLPLGPIQYENTLTIGAALCPVADCTSTHYQEALSQANWISGLAGDVELMTFSFEVGEAGVHEIRLDEILLVNTEGEPALTSNAAEPQSQEGLTLERLDITNNNVVNNSDAWRIIDVWSELRREGTCYHEELAYFDVNDSGCINVADVQLVLAQWGLQVDTGSVVPEPAISADAVLTVNSAGDAPDANPGDGNCSTSNGDCTLRAAIQEANRRPGRETILFNIRPNGSCPDLVVITPNSSVSNMLEIDDVYGDGMIIDGYSQCGASPNTGLIAGNASIKIEIEGNKKGNVMGILIDTGNNVIRGLALYNWFHQIHLAGSGSSTNVIEGNFIGTDVAYQKTIDGPAGGEGVSIYTSAHHNVIGGTTPAARNIISGNVKEGVTIHWLGASHNRVIGNYIGLQQDGRTGRPNQGDGVDLNAGSSYNHIGGLNPGERNVISGNRGDGVEISHNASLIPQYNHVVGNYIGLDAYGQATADTRNRHRGVTFEDLVEANEVYRNVIVNNGYHGVRFDTVFENKLYDNFVGVAPTGLGPTDVIPQPGAVSESNLAIMPNTQSGIIIQGGSQHNQITTNTIAHNLEYGIYVTHEPGWMEYSTCETYYNTFSRNSIFNNAQQGIRLKSGICSRDGKTYHPNKGIEQPNIQEATTLQVLGTACANCLIEIFIADKTDVNNPGGDNSGEGKVFITSGMANSSGNFTISISHVTAGTLVTATATDGDGNTSGFSRNWEVAQAEPGTFEEKVYLPFVVK